MKLYLRWGCNLRFILMVLAASLCFLANPIQAKCPTYSVQIHGRIECSFKPDVRVVAVLLFSGQNSAVPAKETVMDIRDATFCGQVAFSTYSSSGLLSGDRCRRSPKGALIRLIEADGTESDRRLLKISTDFSV